MPKSCSRCEVVQPDEAFAKKAHRCRACQKVLGAAHYRKNKAKYNERQDKARDAFRELVRTDKESKGCTDCKKKFEYFLLDYDHLDPSKKLLNISNMKSYPLWRVKEEIAKCEVVCALCHRTREFLRREGKL